MFAVHFYESGNLVISQLLNNIPEVGQPIKLKGRKGKVISVNEIGPNKYNVQLEFEAIKKVATVVAVDKKKRR